MSARSRSSTAASKSVIGGTKPPVAVGGLGADEIAQDRTTCSFEPSRQARSAAHLTASEAAGDPSWPTRIPPSISSVVLTLIMGPPWVPVWASG